MHLPLEVIRLILGCYAQQATFTTFLEKKGDKPRTDIARMAGIRLVAATEGSEGQYLDEAMIKSVTGGDAISARFLYKEEFDFVPTHKIFLSTNHLGRARAYRLAKRWSLHASKSKGRHKRDRMTANLQLEILRNGKNRLRRFF